MIHFTYKAKKKDTGETYEGMLDAADRYELYRLVRESGGEIISFKSHDNKSFLGRFFSIRFGGVKTAEKIAFARNLGSMISAGLPVSRALTVMERQTKNKTLKKIVNSLNDNISKGKTLAQAMQGYPKVFSQLFISMVKAGEQSGTLAESLKVVALQMDRSYALVRRIRGALMYPIVVVCAMIVIAIILLTYIIPTLMTTFSGLNVTLPWTTQFIVNFSNLVRYHGILLGSGILIVIILFIAWHRSLSGKKFFHYILIKLPIIGTIVKEVNSARTARTLSSLLNSGVDVVEAVQITGDVIQNVHYKAVLKKAEETIKKGEPISKVFGENEKLYPSFITEMMNVGEETGKMGEMLLGVAVYYEDDVEQATKDMSAVIEPLIMIIIGAAVGFFAVAVISPIYSLVNVIS
jgi:type IV pilus assembly protein PilC